MFTLSVIETEHDRIRTLSVPETETTIERERCDFLGAYFVCVHFYL